MNLTLLRFYYFKVINEEIKDVFCKIGSLCTHETLSPDPHFRLIPVLLFSFTYVRALERRRRERGAKKDGEETNERRMGNKRSLYAHKWRAHFLYCAFP